MKRDKTIFASEIGWIIPINGSNTDMIKPINRVYDKLKPTLYTTNLTKPILDTFKIFKISTPGTKAIKTNPSTDCKMGMGNIYLFRDITPNVRRKSEIRTT